MIIFCFSLHHLLGKTLNKHHQDACAVAHADDGDQGEAQCCPRVSLSDIKHVFKEDSGLDLNFKEDQAPRQGFLGG